MASCLFQVRVLMNLAVLRLMRCFRCDQCGELLEHVSSYENDGKAYCHLDYHEVCRLLLLHSGVLVDVLIYLLRGLRPAVSTAKHPSPMSVSLRWMIQPLEDNGIITNCISFAPNAAIHFSTLRVPPRRLNSSGNLALMLDRTMMSVSRSTRVIRIANLVM